MVTGSRLQRRAAQLRGRSGELSVLGRLTEAVRAGESQVLLVRGEPGVGKTALLDYLAGHAPGCRVARATGVQSEMELAFAGLHQLCARMLDRLDYLPTPQREALRTAFGISEGPPPDRFLVGLAVLGLLSEAADERPLICLVDDVQWLDRASAQTLGFVARRLAAEPVGLVLAARVPDEELAGLPELEVQGLREDDARALLDSVLTSSLDTRVRDLIVAETRGNPLALLELPQGLTPAQLAGGFGLPGAVPLAGRIEENFRHRLDELPIQTRRLLQLAAADPSGDPLLVWRAAERLGIPVQAGLPAAEAELVEFGTRVRFRHPLLRSAAYRSASPQERQEVHRALAEATDPAADPDRRAWHRARATPGPDEDVAAELERSAGRAKARGGWAAAAAFGERAALLTPDPGCRVQRLLAAAWAKRYAGELEAALGLLVVVEASPLEPLQVADVEYLRGQIAADQSRDSDAARMLLSAARRLEPLDAALAREAHLEALVAAIWAGDRDTPSGFWKAAAAARAAPPGPELPRAVDVMLDALAIRLTEGHAAAEPALARALGLLLKSEAGTSEADRSLWLATGRIGQIIAIQLYDFGSWQALATRQAQSARAAGALVQLQFALNFLAETHLLAGELAEAARLIDEDRLIAEASGNPPVGYTAAMLAAWHGQETPALGLIESTVREATARGQGRLVDFSACASAVLYNGLGRHDAAGEAIRQVVRRGPMGYGHLVVPELAEAAARTGDAELVRTASGWLSARTGVNPTEWALGVQARVKALLSDGKAADHAYRESIDHLSRSPVRAQLARSHLLYGEWLRRERRRGEAREQLRTAYATLDSMGMAAFAERARRELQAAGETARPRATQPERLRPPQTREALTAQEARVARLALDGLSNPEIGARLFISPRTVQYHLSNVFAKLGITSRGQLHRVLPGDPDPAPLG